MRAIGARETDSEKWIWVFGVGSSPVNMVQLYISCVVGAAVSAPGIESRVFDLSDIN